MHVGSLLQSKVLKGALLSALLAGVAAYLLLINLVGDRDVVIANRYIKQGERIKAEWLSLKRIPKTAIVDGALSETGIAVGKRLKVDRMHGDQVTRRSITSTDLKSENNDVQPGSVLMSLRVKDYQAIGKYVEADEHVSIMAVNESLISDRTQTAAVVTDVHVVEASTAQKNSMSGNNDTLLVVAVTPEQAERLAALESKNSLKVIIDGST